MKNLFLQLKDKLGQKPSKQQNFDEYVELGEATEESNKVLVRPFNLTSFESVKPILGALREGYTIALVNIKALKDQDIIELKRAINKLKKTCDAIDGDVAGFGEDYIVAVPNFASIYRESEETE